MKKLDCKFRPLVFFFVTLLIGLFSITTAQADERLIIITEAGEKTISLSNDGNILFNPDSSSACFLISQPATPGRMDVGYGGEGGGSMEFYSKTYSGREGQFKFIYGGDSTLGSLTFTHYDGSSWNDMMTLDYTGRMDMSGGAYCDGQSWVNASSRVLKENISDLSSEDALETLQKLEPVSFSYKTDPSDTNLGFIAEDVPSLVATKDRKGTSTMDFVALLTKVVQDQQKQIDYLETEINKLRQ